MIVPTARAAFGLPARAARPAYVAVSPKGTRASSCEDALAERRQSAQVDREVERVAAALEVLVELAAHRCRPRRGERSTRRPASRSTRSSSASGSGSNEIRRRPRSVAATSSCAERASRRGRSPRRAGRCGRLRRGSGGRDRSECSCGLLLSQPADTGRGGLAGRVRARVERRCDLVVGEVVAVAEHHRRALLRRAARR